MAASAPACAGGSCKLFGPFGILVQGLIGVWCLLTLLALWRMETPRRPLLTWLGDMSKQMVGAGWGHFMNVFLAVFLGEALETTEANNQCVWYLVGFLSDIVFVTFLCWAVTAAVRPSIQHYCGIDIGDYEHTSTSDGNFSRQEVLPPWMMWCCQTTIWLAIMTFVKLVVSVAVYFAKGVLYMGLAMAFHAVGLCNHTRAQLVTSVILVPIVGDAFQFAVQDSFLKKRSAQQEQSQGRHMLEQYQPEVGSNTEVMVGALRRSEGSCIECVRSHAARPCCL